MYVDVGNPTLNKTHMVFLNVTEFYIPAAGEQ